MAKPRISAVMLVEYIRIWLSGKRPKNVDKQIS
jgi:hypothetical protein